MSHPKFILNPKNRSATLNTLHFLKLQLLKYKTFPLKWYNLPTNFMSFLQNKLVRLF